MKVKFKKLSENAVMPKKAHPTDAGFDLVATSREVDEYGNIVYGTGLAVEIPDGYVGLAFPRSSVSKYNLVMANSTGVIDAHFRGEMKFKFKMAIEAGYIDADNEDTRFFARTSYPKHRVYAVGDRIAQLIIMPIPEIEFEETEELSSTDRGEGGYGSTGR
jgi:dUTP pyrophosphatase